MQLQKKIHICTHAKVCVIGRMKINQDEDHLPIAWISVLWEI